MKDEMAQKYLFLTPQIVCAFAEQTVIKQQKATKSRKDKVN